MRGKEWNLAPTRNLTLPIPVFHGYLTRTGTGMGRPLVTRTRPVLRPTSKTLLSTARKTSSRAPYILWLRLTAVKTLLHSFLHRIPIFQPFSTHEGALERCNAGASAGGTRMVIHAEETS